MVRLRHYLSPSHGVSSRQEISKIWWLPPSTRSMSVRRGRDSPHRHIQTDYPFRQSSHATGCRISGSSKGRAIPPLS